MGAAAGVLVGAGAGCVAGQCIAESLDVITIGEVLTLQMGGTVWGAVLGDLVGSNIKIGPENKKRESEEEMP